MRLDAGTSMARIQAMHDRKLETQLEHTMAKALRNDDMRALSKLTDEVDGERRLVSEPPHMVPISDLVGRNAAHDAESEVGELFRRYRRTLRPDLRALLDRFRYVDLARKVVGVGSVGTRCWVLLLLGRDRHDPLFLRVKEAETSVLEPHMAGSKLRSRRATSKRSRASRKSASLAGASPPARPRFRAASATRR